MDSQTIEQLQTKLTQLDKERSDILELLKKAEQKQVEAMLKKLEEKIMKSVREMTITSDGYPLYNKEMTMTSDGYPSGGNLGYN